MGMMKRGARRAMIAAMLLAGAGLAGCATDGRHGPYVEADGGAMR